jgi:hypothetical protein
MKNPCSQKNAKAPGFYLKKGASWILKIAHLPRASASSPVQKISPPDATSMQIKDILQAHRTNRQAFSIKKARARFLLLN